MDEQTKEYFKQVRERLNELSDEEFSEWLKECGIDKYIVDDTIKIKEDNILID